MLKTGAIILTLWSGINFLLAALILGSVVLFHADSPLLVMVFEKQEIAMLDARIIASLNTLTILYNSCSMMISVLVWAVLWKNLMRGESWAFWLLLFGIGFIEVMAIVASAQVAHARWQVNLVQSLLYIVGVGVTGYALLHRREAASTIVNAPI